MKVYKVDDKQEEAESHVAGTKEISAEEQISGGWNSLAIGDSTKVSCVLCVYISEVDGVLESSNCDVSIDSKNSASELFPNISKLYYN